MNGEELRKEALKRVSEKALELSSNPMKLVTQGIKFKHALIKDDEEVLIVHLAMFLEHERINAEEKTNDLLNGFSPN